MKASISDRVLKTLLINFCLFLFMIATVMAGIVADAGHDSIYKTESVVVLNGSKNSDSDVRT